MAKRARKHQFHCEKCGYPCEIYRKGKMHRVLVCPQCGVLATNPFSIKRAFTGGTIGAEAGALVGGIGAIPGAIGGALIGGFSGKKEKETSTTAGNNIHPVHRASSIDKIRLALER